MRTIGFVLAAAILVTLLLALDVMDTLELPARDLALRTLPERPAQSTRVIAIDEASLRARGAWPWPRAVLAEIIDRCARAGARAVVLDILLSEPRADDATLARAMRRMPTLTVSVLIEGEQWLIPSPTLRKSTRIAHGNFELDHDGILRRFASTKQNGTIAYTALSLEAASLMQSTAVPVGQSIAPAFRTAPRSIPALSADAILSGRYSDEQLRGRIIFVGPTALGLGDRVLTPVSRSLAPDAGVTVHAAATESLLRDEQIRAAAPITGGVLAGLVLAFVLALREHPRAIRLGGALVVALLIAIGGALLLADTGIAIPFVSLLATVILATATIEAVSMTASLEESHVALADQREHDLESKRLLAHELKTPIASMRNLTQLLAGFDLSDAERQRVAVLLQSEAGKLETMVQALLDLERLSIRDFAAASRVTNVSDIVSERTEVLSATRALQTSIARDVFVRGDAMLLERVVDNLVSNALKYTDGDVRIALFERDGNAVLEVADRGAGLSEADRERVFQRFYRGASATGTEGLGLGLAFVAEVARWHGGRVTVENLPDGGACFRFALPVVRGGA